MAVFDVILLVIVILCVIVGMRRGFVLTLCGVLSIVVALVGAKVAADQFSPVVTQAIAPRMETVIEARLNESIGDTVQNSTNWDESDFDASLGGILGIFQQNEVVQDAISGIQDSIQSGVDAAVQTAAGSMAQEIAQPVAWGTVYVIAFVVILLLWNLISKALDLVAKLPVLHFFNRLLGGACGVIKGILIVGCICCLILNLGLLPSAMAQESVFLRLFSGFVTTSI